MKSVVILGTGLIGSSFGLALKAAGFGGRILGVSSPPSIEAALSRGAIDAGTTIEKGVPGTDLVYLAQPISRILELLPLVARHASPHALVTDAGSTKRRIVERAAACFIGKLFVGGHPMAGKEARGATAADPDLFRRRPYFLTTDVAADPRVGEFRQWLVRIGAKPVLLTAAEHDRLVAATSHLPQMLSTALAAVLAQQPGAEDLAKGGGPGLADMTRLALSAHEIWADILATNGDEIGRLLEAAEAKIREIRMSLGDSKAAFDLARSFAERVPRRTV